MAKRVVLAPAAAATPVRAMHSPSRRNVIAGLQSSTPWRPVDPDSLLLLLSPRNRDDGEGAREEEGDGYDGDDGNDGGEEDKENALARSLLRSRGAELTSPEKRMTVEEWIYHNAALAEQMLRRECEAMVSAFEREGSRAMRVLEGLVVE